MQIAFKQKKPSVNCEYRELNNENIYIFQRSFTKIIFFCLKVKHMEEEVLLLKLRIQEDSKNASTINGLIKANRQLAKIIKDAPREGTEAYKRLEKQLDSAKKQYADNKKEIDKFNKSLKTGQKQFENAEDSLKAYSKNLKRLEDEYKSLSRTERRSAVGRQLQKQIKATRAELLRAEKGLGDFRRQVGRYTTSLVGLNSGLGTVLISFRSFSSAIRGLPALFSSASTAAKAFLVTLGPISIALALITAALSKFQSVIDRVSGVLSGVSAVFDVVVERIGRVGIAFQKLQNFDFSGFAKDAKEAFAGIGEEIKNDFNLAVQLNTQLNKLRDDEIKQIFNLAKLELDIANARKSAAENEKTNRLEAIRQIDIAIEKTQKRGKIEIDFATRRRDILVSQTDLTNELTRAEDARNREEARAKVIKLEADLANKLTALTKIRERLRKVNKENNEEQVKGLQFLINEQGRLTTAIKDQILAGEDFSDNLKELQSVTVQITQVNDKFKELTESTTDSINVQKGSINDYNKQIQELNDSLGNLTIGSEEYQNIANQIAQIEAQRASATGELTTKIDELNMAQMEGLAILEDTETELRIRQNAQKEIESLTGTAEEVAKERARIEEELQLQLNQIQVNRLEDNKEILNQELSDIDENLKKDLELFANNELKKQELLLIAQGKRDEIRQKQLEIEKELLEISADNFDKSEKKKTDSAKMQSEKRKQLEELALDTSIQAAGKIVELFSVIQQQQTQKQLDEINQREEAAIREAELVGKTEDEKQQIREKFEKEREELERQSANERKAIAISEALIDIAGAVLKSLNSPPPANVALAASTAALGAIQLAIISATQFADGGLVTPVKLSDGRIVNTPNIKEMSNGDNILATVRVGEAVINERQIEALGGARAMQLAGVPGFAEGGHISLSKIDKVHGYSTGGKIPAFSNSLIFAKAMANGGLATVTQTSEIKQVFEKQNAELGKIIESAVANGAAIGTKSGVENSDITGQISRESERQQIRTINEQV